MEIHDSVLAYIALGLEDSSKRLNLTLKVSDLWITGVAVSPQDWVDALEQIMTPDNAETTIALIREVIQDMGEQPEWLEFGRLVREVAYPEPIYLHLVETSVLWPSGISRPFNGLFRCRFDEVSAWVVESATSQIEAPDSST